MGGSSSRTQGFSEEELIRGLRCCSPVHKRPTLLRSGAYQNIVVMCGAGISTSAGIPDFQSPSAGLYFKLRQYNLPYAEAVFDGAYFKQVMCGGETLPDPLAPRTPGLSTASSGEAGARGGGARVSPQADLPRDTLPHHHSQVLHPAPPARRAEEVATSGLPLSRVVAGSTHRTSTPWRGWPGCPLTR